MSVLKFDSSGRVFNVPKEGILNKPFWVKNDRSVLSDLMRFVRRSRLLRVIVIISCLSIILLCSTIKAVSVVQKSKPRKRIVDRSLILESFKESIITLNEVEFTLREEALAFTERKEKPKIPKIFHQIYRNSAIPSPYEGPIRSWVEANPEYEYWFWDDWSGRALIASLYSEFLPLYDSYCHDLFRADALRYFILYEFGGIYVDMDYVSLKPLDDLLVNHSLHIVEEHGPQAELLYNQSGMVMNAFMAAVPNHPFMNFLINSLPSRARCPLNDVLESTGPLFVMDMMDNYYHITQCRHHACKLNILPYTLMMPEWDANPEKRNHKIRMCRRSGKLSKLQLRACDFFRKNNFVPPKDLGEVAYATHKFLHIGSWVRKDRERAQYVDIREIVPKVVHPVEKLPNIGILP